MSKLLLSLVVMLCLFGQEQRYKGVQAERILKNASEVSIRKGDVVPAFIKLKSNSEPASATFIEQMVQTFGVSDRFQYDEAEHVSDKLGQTHKRFKQTYNGIEILGAEYILHEENGFLARGNGRLISELKVSSSPNLSERAALEKALTHVNADVYKWDVAPAERFLKKETGNAQATFYPKGKLYFSSKNYTLKPNELKLVYRFDIYAEKPLKRQFVEVDAHSGEIINVIDRIHTTDVAGTGASSYNGTVNMTVDNNGGTYRLSETGRGNGIQTWNLQNGTDYSSAVDFTDTDTHFDGDGAAVNAHWGAEQTFDFFNANFGRNSYDNNGAKINSYVHFSSNYVNAFWDGQRMTYGDGDGSQYGPLVSLDIVGHEISHAVTEHSANLVYSYESGALNESFSDIFGEAIENRATGSNDWLMGDDIGIGGSGAIRSMVNPNAFGDPDTYNGTNWYTGSGDNGGVHTNSGVQNYWFYLLSVGASGTNDHGYNFNVTGISVEKAAAIAYRNLTTYLTSSSNYLDARSGAEQSAIDLYGANSQEHLSTIEAWNAVGVAAAVPALMLPETNVLFESTVVNQPTKKSFKIANTGTGVLNITDIQLDNGVFSVNETTFSVNSSSEYTIDITFTPISVGTQSATLTVFSDVDTLTASLEGIGQNAPEIELSETSFSFTLNEGDSAQSSFTVSNNGSGQLTYQIKNKDVANATASLNKRGMGGLQALNGIRSIDNEALTEVQTIPAQTYYMNGSGAGNIAILGAHPDPSFTNHIVNYLLASNKFQSVTFIDGISVTPSVEELQAFDGVGIFAWYSWPDQNAVGDVLANYLDEGGNLLVAFAANAAGGTWNIGGRFHSENYWLLEPGGYEGNISAELGEVSDVNHPIMNGVTTFRANSKLQNVTSSENATILARFSDNTPLVAINEKNGRRVDLSTTIFNSELNSWGLDFSTDADELVINAFEWLVGKSKWLSLSISEDTLSQNESQVVNLEVNTTSVYGGTYNSNIVITSNDPVNGIVEIPVSLDVLGVPEIDVPVTSYTFPQLYTNTSDTLDLLINNQGSDEIIISSISIDNSVFAVDVSSFSVPPKSSAVRKLIFAPTNVGSFAGTLTINSNDTDEPSVTVNLSGSATEPPVIETNPASFEITLNEGDTTDQTLTLSNTGSADLVWALSYQDSNQSLIPSGTTFATETEHAEFIENVLKKRAVASVNGNTVEIGIAGAYSYYYGTLNGDSELNNDYRFVQISDGYSYEAIKSYKFLIIAEDYASISESEADAIVSYLSNKDGRLLLAMNSFISLPAAVKAKLFPHLGFTYTENIGYYSYGSLNTAHKISEGLTSLNNFGSSHSGFILNDGDWVVKDQNDKVVVATKNRVVTFGERIGNWYSYNPQLVRNAIRWLDKGWLEIDQTSGTITSGSTVDLTLKINTETLLGGDYLRNLKIASNDPVNPVKEVPVNLTVVGIPMISTVDSLAFTTIYTNSTDSQALEIVNDGSDWLEISSIDFSNAVFSVANGNFSVPPKSKATFQVYFSSATANTYTETMTMNSNASNNASLVITLTGETIEPPVIETNPASFDVTVNSGDSSVQTLTISNTGSSDLAWNLAINSNNNQNVAQQIAQMFESSKSHDSSLIARKTSATNNDVSVLVVQNTNEWGLNIADLITNNFGISPVVIGYEAISTTDFNKFSLIVTSGDQSSSYYEAISNARSKFEDFVQKGGVVQYQLATQGPDVSIVGEVQAVYGNNEYYNRVVYPNHKITFGLDSLLQGSMANHNYLENLPENALHLIETQNSRVTTTAEYSYGRGHVIATGMTYGHLYTNGYNSAQLIVRSLEYSLSLTDKSLVFANTYSGLIEAGASEDIKVKVWAEKIIGGEYPYTIRIASNDPVNPAIEIPYNLTVIGIPDIVAENSVQFNTVFTDQSDVKTLVIENLGTADLEISSISFSDSRFSVDSTIFTVPAQTSVTRTLTFVSADAGTFTGTMTVNSNDPDEAAKMVTLTATALVPPVIGINPTEITQTLNEGDSAEHIITISNTGGSDLNWRLGNVTAAKIQELLSEPPSRANGLKSSSKVQTESLVDQRTEATFSDVVNTYDLPVPAWTGATSLGNFIYLINYENGYVYRLNKSSGEIIQLFAGSSSGAFGITNDGTNLYISSYGNEIKVVDLNGQLVKTLYKPSSYYHSLAFDGTHLWAAKGLGSNPQIYKMDLDGNILVEYQLGHEIEINDMAWNGSRLYLTSNNTRKLYILSFENGVFEIVDSMDSPHNVEAYALAADANFVWTTDWDGPLMQMGNAAGSLTQFSKTSGTIPAGSSEEMTLLINATNQSGGVYEPKFVFESNDPATSSIEVSASITVIGQPNIYVGTDSLNFGTVYTDSTNVKLLAITNQGSGELTISDIQFSSAEFSIDSTSFTVQGNTTVYRQVRFENSSEGSYTSTFTIHSNDADEATVTGTVLATAIQAPSFVLSETEMNVVLSKGDSVTKSLTLTNNNTYDLTFNISIEDSLAEPASFHYRNEYRKTEETYTSGKLQLPKYEKANLKTFGDEDSIAGGYRWKDGNFTWMDITAVGTPVTLSDDSESGFVDLGFDFEFFNDVSSQVNIGSNGYLVLPDNARIYFMSYDLHPGSGSCHYYYDQANRRFIVQFTHWTNYGSQSGDYTMQVVLNENGKIQLLYKEIINPVSASVRISSGNNNYLVISENTPEFFQNERAIEIFNVGKWLTTTSKTVTVPAGQSLSVPFNLTAENLEDGDYVSNVSFDLQGYHSSQVSKTIIALKVTSDEPIVVAPIEDMTLTSDAEPVEINLNTVFDNYSDLDRPLTFKLFSNSNNEAASVTLTGDILKITPSLGGETTVKVQAQLGEKTITDQFNVTVISTRPEIASAIADFEIGIDAAPVTLNLDSVFKNKGDSTIVLTYQIVSLSDTTVVGVELNKSLLNVSPRQLGETKVTVQASYKGQTATDEFSVKVIDTIAPELFTTVTIQQADTPRVLFTVSANEALLEAPTLSTVIGTDTRTYTSVYQSSDDTYTLDYKVEQHGLNTFFIEAKDKAGNIGQDTVSFTLQSFASSKTSRLNVEEKLSLAPATTADQSAIIVIEEVKNILTKTAGKGLRAKLIDPSGSVNRDGDELELLTKMYKLQTPSKQAVGINAVYDISDVSKSVHEKNKIALYKYDSSTETWARVEASKANRKLVRANIKLEKEGIYAVFYNENEVIVPTEFMLGQNFPNPFNPTTTIPFDLKEAGNVNIVIYNILGQKIKSLVSKHMDAGFYDIEWDATNDFGKSVGSGMYFYQIHTKNFVKSKKMVLVK